MKALQIIIGLGVIGSLPSAFTACSSSLPDAATQNNSSLSSTSSNVTTTTTGTDTGITIVTGGTTASTLTLTASNLAPAAGSTISLVASGGTPSYAYALSSGSGTLSGNTYATPASGETAVFVVTDSVGNQASLTVTVSGPTMIQIYQYYVNGSHFFTTLGDGYVGGTQPDGPAYKLLVSATSNTKPFYRCVIPNTSEFFETDQANCEGMHSNATLGYIYATQVVGTLPLYRYVCGSDHIDSTATSMSGCGQEGPFGYVAH